MTGTDSNGNTNAPPFSMYATGGGGPPIGFNRYVAYNPSLPNQGIYGAPPAVAYNNNTTTPNTFAPPTAPGMMNMTSYNTMGGPAAIPLGSSGLPPRPAHQQSSQIPRPINVFDPDAEVTNISNQSNSIL